MPAFYISMRPLPHPYFPTRILRSGDLTLQIVDPRASKPELLDRAYDLLEPWEHEAGCRAYGQPPPGQPMSDDMVTGAVLPYVPPSLRVPGEPPVQNPDLATEAGREAYLAALDWARLEHTLRSVETA